MALVFKSYNAYYVHFGRIAQNDRQSDTSINCSSCESFNFICTRPKTFAHCALHIILIIYRQLASPPASFTISALANSEQARDRAGRSGTRPAGRRSDEQGAAVLFTIHRTTAAQGRAQSDTVVETAIV
eukprot:5226060-Pleurochrysis_carterae.AAC.3